MKRKPVADRIVVVMGASSRIGRATALAFARAGARLVVSARGPRGLESLVAEIQGFGGHALSVVAETRVFSHVHEVAEKAERELGGLDTWVQAAEMPTRQPFEKMTPAELSQAISLGVVGHAYAALAAIPIMKRHGGGQLIHVSPAPGAREPSLHVAAVAANRGVAGLLDSLRLELKRQGTPIGVTRVVPPANDPERVAAAIVRAASAPAAKSESADRRRSSSGCTVTSRGWRRRCCSCAARSPTAVATRPATRSRSPIAPNGASRATPPPRRNRLRRSRARAYGNGTGVPVLRRKHGIRLALNWCGRAERLRWSMGMGRRTGWGSRRRQRPSWWRRP